MIFERTRPHESKRKLRRSKPKRSDAYSRSSRATLVMGKTGRTVILTLLYNIRSASDAPNCRGSTDNRPDRIGSRRSGRLFRPGFNLSTRNPRTATQQKAPARVRRSVWIDSSKKTKALSQPYLRFVLDAPIRRRKSERPAGKVAPYIAGFIGETRKREREPSD